MSSWWLILLPLSPLPVGADRSVRRTPWVTYAILILNALIYLATLSDGPEVFHRWGVIPADFHVAALFTAPFFHVSLLHLFWNSLFLWVFGPLVEDALGPLTFAMLYVGGGAVAGLLDGRIVMMLAAHNEAFQSMTTEPVVGASGAITAILAPFAIRYHRSKIHLIWLPALLFRRRMDDFQMPAVYAILFLVVENVAGAVYGWLRPESDDIAYWAHLGGFAFGYAVAGLSGLFMAGTQEGLIDEARAAAARGPAGYPIAVGKYQAYLELEPKNLPVRLEYVEALVGLARINGNATMSAQAAADLQSVARSYLDTGDLRRVVGIVTLAKRLGLPMEIPLNERLRVAVTAQEIGDRTTAVALLESLVDDQSTADDEIARLRLGQLLVDTDPARAAEVLDSLISRYPDSEWIRMARQLRGRLPSNHG